MNTPHWGPMWILRWPQNAIAVIGTLAVINAFVIYLGWRYNQLREHLDDLRNIVIDDHAAKLVDELEHDLGNSDQAG